MDKKLENKIEKFYEKDNIEGVLELLDTLPEWGKEEYGEYARALNNIGKPEEALEYLMKEEAKEDTFIWNYRVCYSYSLLENWEKVIFYGKRALELDKKYEEDICYFLIESYEALKKPDEVIQILENHPDMDEIDWNSFYGKALVEKNEKKKAIPYLKKAVSLWKKYDTEFNWDGEEVTKLLAKLYYDLKMTKEFEQMKKKYHYSEANFDISKYTKEEEEQVIAHIEKYFGKIEKRIPDLDAEHVNIDILIIPASTKHPYTTLMTLGMGGRFMDGTPEELIPDKFGYDELFLCLPDDWEFGLDTMWAVQYLLDMARFPFSNKSWLGAGHSISYDIYLGNSNFTGFMITYPYEYGMEAFQLDITEEKRIHFYNIVPLYTEELDYKQEVGFEELESLFIKNPMVTDIHRANVALNENISNIEYGEEEAEEYQQILYQ